MHWGTILRNILSNSTSYLVTALIGFLLTPFIVRSLGDTGYGLWTLVISLTGYFGLLDLGIRSSVGRFVARNLALKDSNKVNRTINTAFVILAAGGILAVLVTALMVQFFFGAFELGPQYEASAKTALLICGLNMGVILPFAVFSAVLIALERFDFISGVTIASELTRATLVVIFLKLGHGLVAIAGIALLVSVLQYTAITFLVRSSYRSLKLSPKFVDRETARDLVSFGVYRFVWIVANQLIFYSQSVLIGIFLNAGAITYYAIAASLINYGRNVVSLAADTLYPAAARMDARQDLAGLQRLMILGSTMVLSIGLPLCLGFVFLGKQFISLWMGPQYSSSAAILIVLTIPQFIGLVQYISALILAGMARHKILAYLALAEGLANLGLSIVLVQKAGLIGIAWGTAIPGLVCTAILIPVYTLRLLNMRVREYLLKACLRPVLCALPVAGLGFAFQTLVEHVSWPVFAAEALTLAGVFAILSYFICLDAGQRSLMRQRVATVLNREAVIHEA